MQGLEMFFLLGGGGALNCAVYFIDLICSKSCLIKLYRKTTETQVQHFIVDIDDHGSMIWHKYMCFFFYSLAHSVSLSDCPDVFH